jgi:tRNA-dihydrouridine synthase C
MEGVVDYVMRDFLTSIGGIDQCFTEFIRVTDKVLPESVIFRDCPELMHEGANRSKTKAGTPITLQLLGGEANPLAESAARAVELGATGIDLNFGCPAKTVNRHDGGASLLKYPERIFNIVSTVRKTVPSHIPVSAKIRLGFDHPEDCLINSEAISRAGASHLTVHCRTKTDFYKPPAHWHWIPKIRNVVNIPIIANGDIFSVEDFLACKKITDCDQFMIGRGVLRDPFLFLKIKAHLNEKTFSKVSDLELQNLILKFFDTNSQHKSPRFAQARTKQWLRNLAESSEDIKILFEKIKTETVPEFFREMLRIS